jgi:hypothetical protein
MEQERLGPEIRRLRYPTTRTLLNRLREARKWASLLEKKKAELQEKFPEQMDDWEKFMEPYLVEHQEEAERLKKILATREHVPNKAERRRIRQERARSRRGRRKGRNR